jgi:hypothetical protein
MQVGSRSDKNVIIIFLYLIQLFCNPFMLFAHTDFHLLIYDIYVGLITLPYDICRSN